MPLNHKNLAVILGLDGFAIAGRQAAEQGRKDFLSDSAGDP